MLGRKPYTIFPKKAPIAANKFYYFKNKFKFRWKFIYKAVPLSTENLATKLEYIIPDWISDKPKTKKYLIQKFFFGV